MSYPASRSVLAPRNTGVLTALIAPALWVASAFSPVHAFPIHYDIDFTTGTQGTLPTGSFDYDASKPANQQFSNFILTWNSEVFDFTNSANTFTFRTDAGFFAGSCSGTPGINDAFEILTHAPCVASQATLYQWQAVSNDDMGRFVFVANSGTGANTASDAFAVNNFRRPSFFGGDFSNGYIAQAIIPSVPPTSSVPELSTNALIGLAFAGLGFGCRRRAAA